MLRAAFGQAPTQLSTTAGAASPTCTPPLPASAASARRISSFPLPHDAFLEAEGTSRAVGVCRGACPHSTPAPGRLCQLRTSPKPPGFGGRFGFLPRQVKFGSGQHQVHGCEQHQPLVWGLPAFGAPSAGTGVQSLNQGCMGGAQLCPPPQPTLSTTPPGSLRARFCHGFCREWSCLCLLIDGEHKTLLLSRARFMAP